MGKIYIGWAEESLIPEKKVNLSGQFYERISDYVESEITVTAMAVKVDGEQMILVSADVAAVNETIVKEELDKLDIAYTEKYCEGSVVGVINPEKSHFTIGIRADMDGLPIQEKTGLPYASKIDGQMHACGHDAHTACVLGVAKALQAMRDKIDCRILLIFQPN